MVNAQDFGEAPKSQNQTESVLSQFASHERFLRALFDDAPYGVFITTADGKITACNRHVADMLGYSREQMLAHHFNEFTYPEDRHIGLDIIRGIIAGQLSHSTLEKRYVRQNGDIIWVHLSVSVVRDDEGAVEFFVTTFEDISKERLQTQALLESEQRVKGLLEAIPYVLYCVNVDGMCVYYKPARDHADVAPDSILGKRLHEMLPKDVAQLVLDTAKAVLSTNQAFNVEYQVADGIGVRHYEAHVAPFGANEAIVLALDVTDRIASERDRAEAQAAIIEGQREVLRQISTPLMPIAEGVIAMPPVGPVDR